MPKTGSGRSGISFSGTTEYTDEESFYLRKINELRSRLASGGRLGRQPTAMEIAEAILEAARELGYRKLTEEQAKAWDDAQAKARKLAESQAKEKGSTKKRKAS